MKITVIGAGVSGLSIAFHLRERGLGDVTVIDGTGVAAGASGVAPGGVRRQWSTRAACLMAAESYAFYADLTERLGVVVDANFDPCGYVFAADTEATLAQLAANVMLQNEAGVPSRLLAPAEAEELVPGLQCLGAAYCAEDGYFDRPQSVVEAFAAAALAQGAQIELAEATGIERDGAGWRLETVLGELTSDCVVVAAAGGSVPLLAPLGFELPIASEARHLFRSDPLPGRVLDPLVIAIDRGIAAKQLADGRLLASDLHATGDSVAGQAAWRARILEHLATLLPGVEVTLPNMVSGVYDLTPDAQPVIDELADGLWVAAGFSGHGFMIAPSTGQLIAGALAGDSPPEWHERRQLEPVRPGPRGRVSGHLRHDCVDLDLDDDAVRDEPGDEERRVGGPNVVEQLAVRVDRAPPVRTVRKEDAGADHVLDPPAQLGDRRESALEGLAGLPVRIAGKQRDTAFAGRRGAADGDGRPDPHRARVAADVLETPAANRVAHALDPTLGFRPHSHQRRPACRAQHMTDCPSRRSPPATRAASPTGAASPSRSRRPTPDRTRRQWSRGCPTTGARHRTGATSSAARSSSTTPTGARRSKAGRRTTSSPAT